MNASCSYKHVTLTNTVHACFFFCKKMRGVMKPFNTNEMGTRTPKEQHRASRLIYNGLAADVHVLPGQEIEAPICFMVQV